jgi:hypothetical protein
MMSAQTIAMTIQWIIAPVVMISACSIFVNGLLSRYAAVNDRMRAMARERLELCFVADGAVSAFNRERLAQIDHQLPELLDRHKQLRDSVMLHYIAVTLFILDMFVIAATAAMPEVLWLPTAVLVVFLSSTGAFFIGVLVAVREVRASHHTVMYEVERIETLNAGQLTYSTDESRDRAP